MQLELIILFQVLGFIFLALGIVPYRRDVDSGSLPLANKIVFLVLSSTLFFLMGMLGSAYTISYCHVINETVISNPPESITVFANHCGLDLVEDPVLGYINFGMGWISMILAIIVMLLALGSRNDQHYNDEEV